MRLRFISSCALAVLSARLPAQTREAVDTADLALPQPGALQLRILSPWILEIEHITEGAPNAHNAPGWCPVGTTLDSPETGPAALQVRVNGRRIPVAEIGWRRRALYAALSHYDLRVGTFLYLQLAVTGWRAPIPADGRVSVEDPTGTLWPSGRRLVATADPLRLSPAIHINEEGFAPGLPKTAMVGYYLGDLGELHAAPGEFQIVEARTGKPVYRGHLSPRPDFGFRVLPQPYRLVLQADFSGFKRPGEYRLQVPGLGASLPFLIDAGIPMGWTRTYALGLYEQRCGAANVLPYTRFVHDACHTAPAEVPLPDTDPTFAFTWKTIAGYAQGINRDNPPQQAPLLTREANALYPYVNRGPIDASGGHHDAGDYSKYTINSAQLVHELIFAADNFPGARALDNLGLPESGDGIPDVLQEAKWEADFLAKLQDRDGGFYFLVYPRDREYESDVLPDHGDPQVVWPKNTSATAAAVAGLAEAGSSPAMKRYFPETAARYRDAARRGWEFLQRAIAEHGLSGMYQKLTFYGDDWTDRDELAWAAAALYAATGDRRYEKQLFDWFPDPSDRSTYRWGWWRMAEGWGNAIRDYAFAARSGRLAPGALDPQYLNACEEQIVEAGDDVVAWSEDNAYATPFPKETKAQMSGGWYFSLDQASDAAVAYLIVPKPEYVRALVGAMNYEGGCNPVNVCFLTGLGVKRQREIVSQYAQNDRRVLPPSGIPIGQIAAGYEYLGQYGLTLRKLSYPPDDATFGPYALYDRWTDVHNVTTEYTALNQARGLMASALLASLTPAGREPWSHAEATIAVPNEPAQVGATVRLALAVRNMPLAGARVVWEGRDQEPAYGANFTFVPKDIGKQWVEAEAEWPDGRRAFAAADFWATSKHTVWFDGSLPAGANPSTTGGDRWAWLTLTAGKAPPSPPGGGRVHGWVLQPGLHEEAFNGAWKTLPTEAGDVLFAWVYIDPEHPPREIMLAWNDGKSWEHRAYWGQNLITYGNDGSAGRRAMGALPPAGRWAELTVPTSAVALSGATLSGMSFSLVDGRVAWGPTGRAQPK